MDIGWLGFFDGQEEMLEVLDGDLEGWGVRPGDRVPAADSYCARMLEGRIGNIIQDTAVEDEVRDLATTRQFRVRAYIGVPVICSTGSPTASSAARAGGRTSHSTSATSGS